jgi:hypothetical protein
MVSASIHKSAAAVDGFARLHRQLLQDRDLQFDFPPFVSPQVPQWLRFLQKFFSRLWSVHGWLVGDIFWGLLACGVLLIVFFIGRHLWRQDWSRPEEEASKPWPEWQIGAEQARILLKDADALAARGDFAGAVHSLLLGSIQEIADRRPGLLRPALTSREISGLGELSAAARQTFSGIARVVERGLFAGRPINAADFAQCRQAFEQFAFPDMWAQAS